MWGVAPDMATAHGRLHLGIGGGGKSSGGRGGGGGGVARSSSAACIHHTIGRGVGRVEDTVACSQGVSLRPP